MSPRIQAFRDLENHPIFRGAMNRMTAPERAWCEEFITKHDHLNYTAFSGELHQWHVDTPAHLKPKKLNTMYSLVMAANVIPPDFKTQRKLSQGGNK
jgi:hypothetical protein